MSTVAPPIESYIATAAQRLAASGWRITRVQGGEAAGWHIAAQKGSKWCVVQVLRPATDTAARQSARRRLGEAVQLPPKLGTMEQWHVHVQPGGRVTFGTDTLLGYVWRSDEGEAGLRVRLGLADRPSP